MKKTRSPFIAIVAPLSAVPMLAICAAAHAQTNAAEAAEAPAPVTEAPAESAAPAEAEASAEAAAESPAATVAGESMIEEIVITSQKRTERLQDVPISVSALAGSMLENSAIDTQQALPQITPNLQVSTTANFTSPYLRGVGTQYANPGLESSVATYFDDQYMPRADANQYSFGDIERIEVLKGPQGTLYGRNATGGAIRIITKDPTDKFEGKLVGTYGRFDRMGLDGVLNTPINDKLSNRFVFRYDTNDGYLKSDNPDLPNTQDRNQFIVRNKLLWQPLENMKVKLTADYGEKADHEGQGFTNLFSDSRQTGTLLGGNVSSGFYHSNINIPANDRNQQKLYGKSSGAVLRVDYETEIATLSSISGYRRISFSGIADLDGTDVPLVTAVTAGTATRNYTQELQAVSRGEGPLSWVAGLYYLKEESNYDFGIQAPDFANPGSPDDLVGGVARIGVHSLAPYAQLTYDFTPKWQSTLGLRYTSETKDLFGNALYMGKVPVGTFGLPKGDRTYYDNAEADEVSFNVFSPKFVVSYKAASNLLYYGSVSKGFKSGGYNTPAPVTTELDKVDPEHITAYELGWKTEFSQVRFNGAVFHYDYQDLQVSSTDSSGGAITKVRNGAKATINGVEFDLSVAVNRRLEFGMGGGWLDATFDEFMGQKYTANPAGGFTAEGADLSDSDLPLAPEFSGYLRAAYNTPLPNDLGLLNFNTVYSYTGDYNYEVDGSISEKARGLLSATLGWSSMNGQFEAALFGTNLTDEKYYVGKTLFPSTGGWGVPAAPAEYGIRLTYNFGV